MINDDKAVYYAQLWKQLNVHELVEIALSNKELWNYDLTALTGFSMVVEEGLKTLVNEGAMRTIDSINNKYT